MSPKFFVLLALAWLTSCSHSFQPSVRVHTTNLNPARRRHKTSLCARRHFQPKGVIPGQESHSEHAVTTAAAAPLLLALLVTPSPALAAAPAGPIPSAVFAWFHFLGIFGVSGGLLTERLVLKRGMTLEEENVFNLADLIYGISAFSLLLSGYFRVTQYAKGWDFYKNEPIFWLKMSSVAVLGGLSFFPAIIFFRRDMARRGGDSLPPLSDAIVDRVSTIINAELLAIATIPLFASLMARGVLYANDFPWVAGVAFYVLSLGGAGYKYGKEAFDMMEKEGALVPVGKSEQ